MRVVSSLCLFLSASIAAGCLPSASGGSQRDGGASGSAADDPAEAFTNALVLGVDSTPTVGPLPTGTSTGPQVLPPASGAMPLSVTPGFPLELTIPWSGGTISSVNIGFGGSRYFSVPVPSAGTNTSGQITIPADMMASVCNNLANVCHQIKCYEQVTTSAGTISKATAQQLVLNCTGGADCNGNRPDSGAPDSGACTQNQFRCGDGTCIAASSVCNGASNCADGSDEDPNTCGNQGSCCIATNGCPGETGSSCANSCCCCPGGQACCADHTQGCCASP